CALPISRLGHLRLQGVPQRGRHARVPARDRPAGPRLRAPRVPADGTSHRRPVGHGAHRPDVSAAISHLELRQISYVYDAGGRAMPALQDITFGVGASEFVCVVGRSGCGKTTLLNILAGFLGPTRGEVRIGGKAVTGKGLDRGIVFQDFAQLFPWRTAQRNVEFGLEMKGVPRAERVETARGFLRLVGLEAFAAAYPHELSGGMQQRAAIARALAYNPSVLLMDGPFAPLDGLPRRAGNDRQDQPRRGVAAMMNRLVRGHGLRLGRDRPPGVRVAIESRIVAAGDLETDPMAALEHHAGGPELEPDLRRPAARRVRASQDSVRHVVRGA